MNKTAIVSVVKKVPKLLQKHSPEILTGIGIGGMVLTTVMAVKATPKALRLIDEAEIRDNRRLSTKEVIRTTWKCYIPTAVSGVCSIACIIGASSINARRKTALAAAYALSMQEFADYKRKTLEVVGEKKENIIRDKIMEEKVENDHVATMPIIQTGNGNVPCYEYLTKRKFASDVESIRKAENNLNRRMREEEFITINEFFEEIGLDRADDSLGDKLGWDIDHGYIELRFTSLLVDGVPYLVVGHNNPPRYIE